MIQSETCNRGAVAESISADGFHGIADGKRLNLAVVVEGAVSDALNRVADGNTCQTGTLRESVGFNCLRKFNRNLGQSGQAIEGSFADDLCGFRNGIGVIRSAVGIKDQLFSGSVEKNATVAGIGGVTFYDGDVVHSAAVFKRIYVNTCANAFAESYVSEIDASAEKMIAHVHYRIRQGKRSQ